MARGGNKRQDRFRQEELDEDEYHDRLEDGSNRSLQLTSWGPLSCTYKRHWTFVAEPSPVVALEDLKGDFPSMLDHGKPVIVEVAASEERAPVDSSLWHLPGGQRTPPWHSVAPSCCRSSYCTQSTSCVHPWCPLSLAVIPNAQILCFASARSSMRFGPGARCSGERAQAVGLESSGSLGCRPLAAEVV